MRQNSLLLVLMGLCAGSSLAAPQIPAKVCDVTQYGANGERQQIALDNTEAIQKAIDDCAANGGGTVRVPAGNYLTNPLFLKSNIRLNLEKNATLVASTEEAAYRITPENKRFGAENGWLPYISVADASNVAISGEGTIDGQGAIWWERWRANIRANPAKRGATDRPRLIYILRSKEVAVDGLTLTNSPSFHVVMRYSEYIEVNKTRIVTPWHAPNTDAIDPIDSRHVRITNNYIDCNDDHVAIKAEKADPNFPNGVVDDIYIANNTLMQGRGISIGSESAGGVRNVLVENNSFKGSMYGIRIKSPRGKGGEVSNIVYRNTRMEDVWVPLVFTSYYQGAPADKAELAKRLAQGGFTLGDQIYPADTDPEQPFNKVKTPHFAHVKVENLVSTGKSMAAAYFVGTPEAPYTDFELKNVKIEAERGAFLRHAAVRAQGLELKVKEGQAVLLEKGGKLDVIPVAIPAKKASKKR